MVKQCSLIVFSTVFLVLPFLKERGWILKNAEQFNSEATFKFASSKKHDLISINQHYPEIKVELKYATNDNFMKQVLYTIWKDAYVQKSVGQKLLRAQNRLTALKPGYHLLVYDAARPLSVQVLMWNGLDTMPVKERMKFVSPPSSRSLHNFACALDLTICDENGVPLDMGAGFDDPRKIAYPSMEAKFLSEGKLTETHIANRKLLRKVMSFGGFSGISTEWWHFNAYSKKEAMSKFAVIETEESINQ